MQRYGHIRHGLLIASLLAGMSGCATLGTLFAPQELSENYTRTPGTIAEAHWRGKVLPAQALIDGDPKTVAETSRDIRIRLPEPRALRRIVMRGVNYEDVIVWVGGRSEGEWEMVKQIKQNRSDTIVVNVNAITDRVRLRIGGTFDDRTGTPPRVVAGGGSVLPRTSTFTPGTPKAGEIELYGLRVKRSQDDLLF